MDVPTGLAGSITIALIVVLGVFVYPWLLRNRFGAIAVAAVTLLLTVLFASFASDPSGEFDFGFGFICALLPIIPGVIVWRLQSKTDKNP